MNNRLQTAAIIVVVTLFVFPIITSLSGILFIQAQEDTREADLKIFPPDSTPYGLTYGEWSAKWWQWAYSMPEEGNPMVDDTGDDCANNQAGPVWFLAGTGGGAVTRECTIPSDKGILIPIINVECDSAAGSGDTEAELRSCAEADQDTVIAKEITIDGVSVGNLDSYRFHSPLFNLTFPENNIAGIAPQTTIAVSDGYWILLEPLSPGGHEIHFKAALGDPTAIGTINFALDVRYILTIVEAQTEATPTQNANNQSITVSGSSANSTLE